MKKTLKLSGDIWIKSYFCPMVMNDFNSIYTVRFFNSIYMYFHYIIGVFVGRIQFYRKNLVYRGSQ